MRSQKQLLEELRAQDEELKKIFTRREETAQIARDAGELNKLHDALFADNKSHFSL